MRLEYVLALLAGASPLAPALAQKPATRDSGSVRIVENPARAKAPTAFQLSEKPVYDIGGRKANRDDELNTISAAALQQIRLSDGHYVVGDHTRFRIFDSTGKQVRVVEQGSGAGAAGWISTICRTRGDTLVVEDGTNPGRRAEVFDGSGKLVRAIPLGLTTYIPINGCFDDGTFLTTHTTRLTADSSTTTLTRWRLDGAIIDTIGVFPRPAFGLFTTTRQTFAVTGHEIYVGDARTNEVRVYNVQGRLTRVIRTADTAEKTTASEQLGMRPLSAPGTDDPTQLQAITDRFNARVRAEPRPDEWPRYGRIMVDPNGGVWIEDYQKWPVGLPDVWTGFDASGKLLGKVTIPAWNNRGDPIIRSFTSDGVVMLRNGDDGMPHLYTYKLMPVKTGTP